MWMRIITFFANKGGSGRSVATMALASGFLAQGKRVAVMDCTGLAGCNPNGPHPSTLQNWMKQMAACKFRPPRLELIECLTPEKVEDSAAAADERGIDILLIDTAARIREPQIAALGIADLIIAPAISPFEARCVLEGIDEYLGPAEDVMCLVNGCRNGAAEAAETRHTFGHHTVFLSELPWAEALSDQILNGDIGHFTNSLACRPDKPGFARFREAQAAWTAVQRLAFEVEFALNGHRLEPFGGLSAYPIKRKAVA